MGAKFIETPTCNNHGLTHLYRDAIENLTNQVARFAKSKSIMFLALQSNTLTSSHILDKPDVCKYIHSLHDRSVIVPVDKAGNNLGIVCKKFYLDVIKNELGITNDGEIIGNKIYKPVYQEATYKIYTNFMTRNFWVYLVWRYSTITNIHLYYTGLQNNINSHINFG